MNGHGIWMCEYGYMHGQCRCAHSEIISVRCDDPSHEPKNAYVAKHAKDKQ